MEECEGAGKIRRRPNGEGPQRQKQRRQPHKTHRQKPRPAREPQPRRQQPCRDDEQRIPHRARQVEQLQHVAHVRPFLLVEGGIVERRLVSREIIRQHAVEALHLLLRHPRRFRQAVCLLQFAVDAVVGAAVRHHHQKQRGEQAEKPQRRQRQATFFHCISSKRRDGRGKPARPPGFSAITRPSFADRR